MKEVPLTKGFVAIIDDADYDRVAAKSWQAVLKKGVPYARTSGRVNSKGWSIYLHRFILSSAPEQIVDHINGNPLDNRRSNLRTATKSQNAANSKKRKGCSSQFKGVSYQKSKNLWEAYIDKNQARIKLGYFRSEIEAALAYDRAAVEQFGEFAKLNFAVGGS